MNILTHNSDLNRFVTIVIFMILLIGQTGCAEAIFFFYVCFCTFAAGSWNLFIIFTLITRSVVDVWSKFTFSEVIFEPLFFYTTEHYLWTNNCIVHCRATIEMMLWENKIK